MQTRPPAGGSLTYQKFMKIPFEVTLWNEMSEMIDNKNYDQAYVFLYNQLRVEVLNKNYDNCDNFLRYAIDKELDTNMIVHILNVLSVVKSELNFWNDFVEKITTILIEREG